MGEFALAGFTWLELTGVDTPPAFLGVAGVSPDGQYVLGEGFGGGQRVAIQWHGGAVSTVGGLTPAAISNTGSIVGSVFIDGGNRRAAVYSAGTLSQLGGFPDGLSENSEATDISADGAVISGFQQILTGNQGTTALRWDAGAVQPLSNPPTQTTGVRVSSDGDVIAGSLRTFPGEPPDRYQAVTWNGGFNQLPFLDPADIYEDSYASGINADGSVVVGYVDPNGSGFQAVRWAGGQIESLGQLPGQTRTQALDVNGAGDRIIGIGGIGQGGFVWDDGLGIRSLPTALVDEFGLDFGGGTVLTPIAISDDGSTIVGEGISPSGQFAPWIARLDPQPIRWVQSLGGPFSTDENWSTDTVPGASDVALFDLTGAYQVTLDADAEVNELRLEAGSVQFNLGASNLTAQTLTVGDNADLRFSGEGGIVVSISTALNTPPAAEQTDSTKIVTITDPISLSGGLAATLEVFNEARIVHNAEFVIDRRAEVRTGFIETQKLIVGDSGTGQLKLLEVSEVTAEELLIGDDLIGSNGLVTVDDNSFLTVSGFTGVGNGNSGRLEIKNGGTFRGQHASVGGAAGSAGVMTIDGVNTDGGVEFYSASRAEFSQNLTVGFNLNAQGTIDVTDGAILFTEGSLILGQGGTGTVRVDGAMLASPSELLRDEDDAPFRSSVFADAGIQVGRNRTGTLEVLNGARVVTDNVLNIGVGAALIHSAEGTVRVIGATTGPLASFPSELIVGGLRVGDDGIGTMQIGQNAEVRPTEGVADPRLDIGEGSSLTVSGGKIKGNSASKWFKVTVGEDEFGGEDGGEPAILNINSGALVQIANLVVTPHFIYPIPGTRGEVTVDGDLTWVQVFEDVGIGDGGFIRVQNNAAMKIGIGGPEFSELENKIAVVPGGILYGSNRVIAGEVKNIGGTVIPGGFPGLEVAQDPLPTPPAITLAGSPSPATSHPTPSNTLTIEGDFSMDAASTLLFRIAGQTADEDYTVLNVTGDAQIAGLISFQFFDGFAPSQGQVFDFMAIAGQADLSNAVYQIEGLQPGFQYTVQPIAGGFQLLALNNGIAIPEPSSVCLVCLVMAVAGVSRKKRG